MTPPETVKRATTRAVEHAFVRAFHVAIKEGHSGMETVIYTLGLMEFLDPWVVREVFSMGAAEDVLLYLVDALYDLREGYFTDVPRILDGLERGENVDVIQHLENKVLYPYIPRIAGIISTAFSRIRDPSILFLALDKYPPTAPPPPPGPPLKCKKRKVV